LDRLPLPQRQFNHPLLLSFTSTRSLGCWTDPRI
jgi:hypothetical protein